MIGSKGFVCACLAVAFGLLAGGCMSTMPSAMDEAGAPVFEPVADGKGGGDELRRLPSQLPPPSGGRAGVAQGAVYRITPGDILEVSVFRVPDLTRTVEVDGAGNINLPLIGSTAAGGKTVRELETLIAGRLGERYIQSPEVTIGVKEAVGLRIAVEGSVKKPGIITARGEMTLLRAIAEAQGFTDTADQSTVIVFRTSEQGRMAARFDVNAIRAGRAPDPAVYGGDMIIVDDSVAKLSWKTLQQAFPAANAVRLFY